MLQKQLGSFCDISGLCWIMVKEMEISHRNENTVKDKLTVTVCSSKVSCEEAKFGEPPNVIE